MKKTFSLRRILLLVIIAMAAVFVPAMKPQAAKAPKAAKTSTYYRYAGYVDKEVTYSLVGTMKVTNLSKSAKIYSLKRSDASFNAYAFDQHEKNDPGISLSYEPEGDYDNSQAVEIPLTSFTISFKVKQNGKVYSLKTKVKIKAHPYLSKALKTIKVDGKNVLGDFKKTNSNLIVMKLAGKKVKLSYSTKKGYKKDVIFLQREQKSMRRKKNIKLKKGDVLYFDFHKSSWRKSESVAIAVK